RRCRLTVTREGTARCEHVHGAYSALLMPSLKRRAPAQYSATAMPLAVQRCPPSLARTLIVPLLQPMADDSSARHVSLSAYAPFSSTHAPASTCRGSAAYTSLGGGSVKRMYGTRGFITGFSTHRIGVPGMRALSACTSCAYCACSASKETPEFQGQSLPMKDTTTRRGWARSTS